MARSWTFLALAAVLLAVFVLAGCGGNGGGVVTIPSVFQGTWIAAGLDDGGLLLGVSLFTVNAQGQVQFASSDVSITGKVTETGAITLSGSAGGGAANATGTLKNDDTGSGVWSVSVGGVQAQTGTFLAWRANGGAYAGTWDVTVAGGATGNAVVTVDANGVGNGTGSAGSDTFTIFGVVTGSGQVVVAWSLGDVAFLGDAPANGSASGSTASGTWQSDSGLSGTWTATKR